MYVSESGANETRIEYLHYPNWASRDWEAKAQWIEVRKADATWAWAEASWAGTVWDWAEAGDTGGVRNWAEEARQWANGDWHAIRHTLVICCGVDAAVVN